jgi:hypothetical protein
MAPEERTQLLRDSPPNTWIALSSDESRVVGRGTSYEDAVSLAEKEGEKDPVLIMTPESWLPRIL